MLNLDVKQSHIHTEVLHNIKHESSVLQLDIEKSHILTYVLRTIKYKRCVVHVEITATHCNTLQHTTTHCNALQYMVSCHTNDSLQHTATHCNTLHLEMIQSLTRTHNCYIISNMSVLYYN